MTATSTFNGKEEPSTSMSIYRTSNATAAAAAAAAAAEDSDGPLLTAGIALKNDRILHPARHWLQTSTMLLHQDNWNKNLSHNGSDEKKNNTCIWTLTCVLAFIGLCNLLLNITILIVLRVSQGMESLEVIPEKDLLKFYGNTDLDKVCLKQGICEGFGDEPIELIGDLGGVNIQIANRIQKMTSSNLKVLKNGTSVTGVQYFQIKDFHKGQSIFSTDFPNFSLPQGVERIEVDVTQTHRIAAPKSSNLTIISDGNIFLHGAEGTTLDSKEIHFTAKNDIFLHSSNGDIIMNAKNGIYISNIPLVQSSLSSLSSKMQDQYKVCVCMPDGKLFLAPAHKGNFKINCATITRTMQKNPCAA